MFELQQAAKALDEKIAQLSSEIEAGRDTTASYKAADEAATQLDKLVAYQECTDRNGNGVCDKDEIRPAQQAAVGAANVVRGAAQVAVGAIRVVAPPYGTYAQSNGNGSTGYSAVYSSNGNGSTGYSTSYSSNSYGSTGYSASYSTRSATRMHVENDHGISTAGMSEAQVEAIHQQAHNGSYSSGLRQAFSSRQFKPIRNTLAFVFRRR